MANTYFKKNPNRKWTWQAPNGTTKNEIDFILANKITTIKDISVLNKFQTGSDHRLVRARIVFDFKLERSKLTQKPATFGININNPIKNSEKYEETLNEKLHEDIDSPQLIKTVLECAKEIGGPQQQNKNTKLTNETKALLRQRREMKSNNNLQRIENRELCKTLRKKNAEDIRKYNEQLKKSEVN